MYRLRRRVGFQRLQARLLVDDLRHDAEHVNHAVLAAATATVSPSLLAHQELGRLGCWDIPERHRAVRGHGNSPLIWRQIDFHGGGRGHNRAKDDHTRRLYGAD